MKHILSLDIEDFSPVDIKYGVYKRAESGEIILLAYSLDYAPVVVLDLTKEKIPAWLLSAFTDPNYVKKAFNAPYERNYLNITLGIYSPPEQWECTQARAAMCGLPLSLDDASKALGLIEKKDPIGKALIRYFCIPCKPTIANDFRTRNLPEHDPEKWQQFCKYNGQDVVVEQNVDKACQWYKIPAVEHHTWCLNERKNERGVMVDMQLIDSAIIINKEFREELIEEATGLTGLSNVNSPKQLKEWLSAEMDEEITSLNKLAVRQMLIDADDEDIKRILTIRQLMAKSSITKYLALKYGVCKDGRVKGMIQYYGANRTGRECLAENTMILIKNNHGIYEKPIQEVLLTDLVFDGDDWVEHEGVVFSGDKDVINHDNICATKEHIVYLDTSTSLTMEEAKQNNTPLWRGNTQFIK